MKWIIIIFLLVAGYAIAGPFITMSALKTGIEQKDSAKLSKNIDFPLLRQNLKGQFETGVMDKTPSGLKDNPLSALAMGFATKLVDKMVEGVVTPAGLGKLMSGEKPNKNKQSADSSSNTVDKKALFQDARFGFDSIDEFSIWVPNEEGDESRFILVRNGFDWKLSNIIVSIDK